MHMLRIGDLTKSRYAASHACEGVTLHRLIADRTFKNSHRQGLTDLYERLHKEDPHFELRHVAAQVRASTSPVLLVTDVRMRYEMEFLRERAPPGRCVLVRIETGPDARRRRGVKQLGTVVQDGHTTEVDLDGVTPDLVLVNDSDDLKATCMALRVRLGAYCLGTSRSLGNPLPASPLPPLGVLEELATTARQSIAGRWERPLIVCIESTIAGGKSTLLRMLSQKFASGASGGRGTEPEGEKEEGLRCRCAKGGGDGERAEGSAPEGTESV